MSGSLNLTRVLGCLSSVAAPLLLLASEVVGLRAHHPLEHPRPGLWFVQHVLLLVGTALFLPAVVALTTMVGRVRALGVAGGVLAGAGVVASTSVVTLDFVAQEMAKAGDQATMRALYVRALDNPAIATLDLVQMALPLGLALVGLGLLREARVPRWSAIALLVAVVLSDPSLGRWVSFVGRLTLLGASPRSRFALFAALM